METINLGSVEIPSFRIEGSKREPLIPGDQDADLGRIEQMEFKELAENFVRESVLLLELFHADMKRLPWVS